MNAREITMGAMNDELAKKIESKSAKIGIVGLGYVGLPLAVEFARSGFEVIGLDISEDRCKMLNHGTSYVEDISNSELKAVLAKGEGKGLRATHDFSVLRDIDCVSICVPTPLGKTKDPDISYILAVRDELKKNLHRPMLVVLESTTYPGTTEEIFEPMVNEAGYTLGEDFFLVFSPERIDPGNKEYQLRNTPKVLGGRTQSCTAMAVNLYSQIVERLVPVTSTASAEMVKILENTYRAVNIGLVNEISIMCKILGINTWEVIEAAATKPFGFTPFYPGPGLGGHCIPVDPHYLSWKLKTLNYTARFIDLAAEINTGMPHHVVTLCSEALNEHRKSVKGSKILLLGIAYKPDVSDTRESPALDIFRLLEERGAEVSFHDPHAPRMALEDREIESVELSDALLERQDLVIITTNHRQYDAARIVSKAEIIVDTRNATKGIDNEKIVRL